MGNVHMTWYTFAMSLESQQHHNTEGIKDPEHFLDLANVSLAKDKLTHLLEKAKSDSDLGSRAQAVIYEMLTRRSDYVRDIEQSPGGPAEAMRKFAPQRKWYKDTIDTIGKLVQNKPGIKWESNPAWFGIHTRTDVPKREGVNFKSYTTIPAQEYSYIQHLPDLAEKLRALSVESDDIIQVKVPATLTGFISNNDSLVVHFKKKENADAISSIVNEWTQSSNLHESPREMDRTKIAADASGSSFSELVAKNIGDWLQKNAGSYDDSVLAEEAVKHAIAQSQKPPTVE